MFQSRYNSLFVLHVCSQIQFMVTHSGKLLHSDYFQLNIEAQTVLQNTWKTSEFKITTSFTGYKIYLFALTHKHTPTHSFSHPHLCKLPHQAARHLPEGLKSPSLDPKMTPRVGRLRDFIPTSPCFVCGRSCPCAQFFCPFVSLMTQFFPGFLHPPYLLHIQVWQLRPSLTFTAQVFRPNYIVYYVNAQITSSESIFDKVFEDSKQLLSNQIECEEEKLVMKNPT